MWFIIVFMCLLAASIYQVQTHKELKKLYYAFLILLTVMLCFRYAQGTDYVTYEARYYFDHPTYSKFEPGYQLLTEVFQRLHMEFPLLIMCIGLVNMLLLNRFINKNSECNIFSLLIAYPTLYLTYFYSIMRQGVAISLFLGVMLECLEKRKYILYYILALLAISFHKSSVVFLVVPIALRFREKHYYYLLVLAILFAILSRGEWFGKLLISLFNHQGKAYSQPAFFVWGILERCALFSLIFFLYHKTNLKENESKIQSILYRIYFLGFIGNIAFSQYFGSRLFSGFKLVEVVLLVNLIVQIDLKRLKQGIMVLISAYLILMIFKNITAYIHEGGYGDITPFEYPYISILNKEESLVREVCRRRVEDFNKVADEYTQKVDVHFSLPGNRWDWFVGYKEN